MCAGAIIDVERSRPVHAIVLIPELRLIDNHDKYESGFIKEFMKTTGSFIHLLDISELLRCVQAAEVLSKEEMQVTPLMALDYYLIKRAMQTLDAKHFAFKLSCERTISK